MKKAVLDPKKRCRACGCCIKSCPYKLLELGTETVIVSKNCKGCGQCVKACPFHVLMITDSGRENN